MEQTMNVYRFSTKGKEPKIVVAKDVNKASAQVDFDWETCKCVYKGVTVVASSDIEVKDKYHIEDIIL